jgi:succinate dehydrogenase flavin-adding protein (antitoxin of CptAB toxin-antitoxin module)
MKTMKEERAAILESFLSMDDRELFLVLTGREAS